MNKDLQSILDFIQQSAHLSDEEKKSILKSLKDANKELEIISFKLDRTEKVKRTTAILLEETIEELEKKRKAVEAQNKELEIESSLERVRTVAMSMNQPDDMLHVCQTISEQLELLKVKEIRNVQTAIFYKEKGTYMNYEYYAKHHKTFITDTTYTNHKIHEEFADKMLKGNGEFMIAHIKADELKAWIEYQKTTNVFIDNYLYTASSLNYYWFSLGPVALGISTYDPLSEEETNLFKRFLKVFELSYRRYLDIELAIKQAKEARIETALERVRAVAMAMRKPDDLLDVCKILFEEFHSLGFSELRNSMINIYNDDNGSLFNYDYSDSAGKTITHFTYNAHATIDNLVKNTRGANDAFIEYAYTGKELDEWREFRKKSGEADDARLNNAEAIYYYFYSIGSGSIGISTFSTIGEEKLEVLKRFRNVFNLSYQRYIDLALADAQAKEARLETALERVRAAAMAMKQSEELTSVCKVIYKELYSLGFTNIRNAQIAINLQAYQSWLIFEYSDYGSINMKKVDVSDGNVSPLLREIATEIAKSKDALFQKHITQKEFEEWRTWRMETDGLDDPRVTNAQSMCFYLYAVESGLLGISTFNEISEQQVQILKRFKKVFELSYTRFDDLQKAEAQAHEAKIEAALERVRAQAMGIRKSEELAGVGKIIFAQLKSLGFSDLRNTEIIINNDAKESILSYYYSDYGITGNIEVFYKTNPTVQLWVNELKKANDAFAAIEISENEMDSWRKYREEIGYMPDLKLNDAKNVFYYSYSTGLGALSISSFTKISDEQIKTLERFRNVFGLAYRRYADVAQAEAQAREAQIELALERVRARTMAMQKSDELAETASVLFKQLIDLGIKSAQMRTCAITTLQTDEPIGECWITSPDGNIIPQSFMVPYNETSAYKTIYAAWKNGEKFLVVHLSGDALLQHLNFLKKYAKIPTQQFQALPDQPKETFTHAMFFSQGYLFIISNEPLPGYHEIFKRFAAVFQQTYTRFLDLQKAEAQARESQIQLALERVRARTMAMQKSDELSETVFILFQQFKQLGENPDQATIGIINEEEWVIEYWVTMYGNQTNRVYKFPIDEPNVTNRIYKAWKEQKKSLVIELSGKELYDFANFRESMGGAAYNPEEKERVINVAFFSKGLINVQSNESRSEESIRLLERFAGVFEQTYTRFLDLQKAEAQAKESQIEAALERVRSRSMGMHKSEELKEVIQVVLAQFVHLNINVDHAGFYINYKANEDMHIWLADPNIEPFYAIIPYFESPTWKSFLDAKTSGKNFYTDLLDFEEKNEFYKSLFKLFRVPEEAKKFYLERKGLAVSTVLLDNVGLYIENFSAIPYTDEENKTLMRFGKVFQQTYTRFNDLQRAEAQVREAQIGSALEKVRSRSLAMHRSEEMSFVMEELLQRVKELEIDFDAAIIIEFKENSFDFWSGYETGNVSLTTFPSYKIDVAYFKDILAAKNNEQELFSRQYLFAEKNKFFNYLFENTNFSEIPEERKEYLFQANCYTISIAFAKHIAIQFQSYSRAAFLEKENDILKRFVKVFEQAYVRFLDLQKAEAQAIEAIKRASVDRVRAEIASMRTTNDLERITPLIWNELTVLAIPFIRCGVFIMDEEQQKVQTFLYTEGKTIASFTSTFSNSKIITEALPYWRKKEIYKTHWDERAFLEQAKSLVEQGAISTGEKYLTEHHPTDLYLHFLPFLQGMLYVGDAAPLSNEHLELVQALADAFSTAYARYEDFNKLEAAKQQVDKTLVDLKQTQTQLIQSEKMASLGELTAGIAHEIQNPLNFVNNFSEINSELIEELFEERNKAQGTRDEKLENEILNDIKENEKKINHHGKRADAIVKGMLQHSRSSTSIKEATDINKLADEYLRLTYHGLRAKDKSFNATMHTDFDETIADINIIPQDIGRVLLNLYTNAFYAVNEKQKQFAKDLSGFKNLTGLGSYEPTITISTKKSNNQISITVSDNGNGIPQKIIDKIFQPFFTTKPTGQGTGLGLSLSYDIVKAHRGEIKVESKEGEGSRFVIELPIA